jgi:hypothetical protein
MGWWIYAFFLSKNKPRGFLLGVLKEPGSAPRPARFPQFPPLGGSPGSAKQAKQAIGNGHMDGRA